MEDQQLPGNTSGMMADFTPEQRRWVLFRLIAHSDKEAAKLAGVHPTTVSKWAEKADMDRVVARLQAAPIQGALEVLQATAIDAAQTLHILLGNKDPKVRLAAAEGILDRVGLGKTEHLDATVTVFDLEGWRQERERRLAEVMSLADQPDAE